MIKVENTRVHFFYKNYALVTDAKLVLVEAKAGLGSNFIFPYPDRTIEEREIGYYPILISEQEEIQVGDWVYNDDNDYFIIDEDDDLTYVNGTYYKIIALPEHFSQQQLQDIVDGKLKDGDKVLIECEEIEDKSYGNIRYYTQIKKPLTIYPVEEKMYTREEVRGFVKGAVYQKENAWRMGELDKWFEQNV